ncbi:MAG: DUF444 family protein, partial [Firmicutes bacterium]|nr:DUF444 family protein [Bacillota bacterium]
MSVVVHQGDWSLDRKGPADQQRHQQQLREAIRKNLPELIADESIVAQNGKTKVKIPLRSRQQYHFRFDWEGKNKVGQGTGGSKVGDSAGGKQQPGSGQGGNGDDPGEEIYEAEVTIDQIEEALFSQLQLPDLQEKEEPAAAAPAVEFTDIRKVGISSNIDKRKTLFNALLRNAKAGQKTIGQLLPQDLRFKTWEEKPLPLSAAVVFAVMDISGSMGLFQKRAARNFFFWTTRFLKTKYQQVEIVYIVHTTQARQVSAQQFFTLGESGGTVCSSAYELVVHLIQQRYPPQRYNNYLLHVSDGENY